MEHKVASAGHCSFYHGSRLGQCALSGRGALYSTTGLEAKRGNSEPIYERCHTRKPSRDIRVGVYDLGLFPEATIEEAF